jgi:hypothetical protein
VQVIAGRSTRRADGAQLGSCMYSLSLCHIQSILVRIPSDNAIFMTKFDKISIRAALAGPDNNTISHSEHGGTPRRCYVETAVMTVATMKRVLS